MTEPRTWAGKRALAAQALGLRIKVDDILFIEDEVGRLTDPQDEQQWHERGAQQERERLREKAHMYHDEEFYWVFDALLSDPD